MKKIISIFWVLSCLNGFTQVVMNKNMENIPSTEGAIQVDFNSPLNSSEIFGIKIGSFPLEKKGVRVGAGVNLEANSFTQQRGTVRAQLGGISVWHAGGSFYGIAGDVTPINLKNFNQTKSSRALGGLFRVGPEKTPLKLNGTGSYWVGGVKGRIHGQIDGSPGQGAVAAVIGVDDATGSAEHYAGYFKGNVRVVGGVHFNGNVVHADYVFEDDFKLLSIPEHAELMWREKHLPGIKKWTLDFMGRPVVELGDRMRGILEEVEVAHIYIEQLNQQLETQDRALQQTLKAIQTLKEEVNTLKNLR